MKNLLRLALVAPALIGSVGCRTSMGTYSLFGGSTPCCCCPTTVSKPVSGNVTEIEPPLAPAPKASPETPKAK